MITLRAQHLRVVLTAAKNVFHHRGLAIARRVFSTAGRSFDLSVVVSSPGALTEADRLLTTLTATPRALHAAAR